ncbi:MAG TPA: TIGR03013 family XrtA/PEP-CTERM system glycosyltransferase [Oleiagrimonas sp.]|nr:TIGR03013 family XrtA/PEP-CTERM system glycosyltransferase [Oleiagrimonas sp.]
MLLVVVEFALLLGCIHAGVVLRYWGQARTQANFLAELGWRSPLIAGILVLTMAALGLYHVHLPSTWVARLNRQIVAFALGWVALTILYYMFPALYLGRGVLGIALALGCFVVLVWRIIFLAFVDADRFKRRVVMLGAGQRAVEVVRQMNSKIDQRGFRILGYVPIGTDPVAVPDSAILRPHMKLWKWARQMGVDEFVVGPDERRGMLRIDDLLECREHGIAVTELAAFFEREAGTIQIDPTNPSWLTFSEGFNNSPMQRTLKRGFDLSVAITMLLLTSPLMLLTALAIRLESGGGAPVLYQQYRVGESGRPFALIKFRSMRVDAEGDGVARWASQNDDRVTRVGAFIRKVRLDELPQLWNVLCGDMSVIGPRPERPQFVDDFNVRIRYYPLRHCIKPGLTGWAQLRYPYGASFEDAVEKLKFDLFYVKNHSIMFDMAILIQTVEVVLFGRGAR